MPTKKKTTKRIRSDDLSSALARAKSDGYTVAYRTSWGASVSLEDSGLPDDFAAHSINHHGNGVITIGDVLAGPATEIAELIVYTPMLDANRKLITKEALARVIRGVRRDLGFDLSEAVAS
jgi:hypothetical protein